MCRRRRVLHHEIRPEPSSLLLLLLLLLLRREERGFLRLATLYIRVGANGAPSVALIINMLVCWIVGVLGDYLFFFYFFFKMSRVDRQDYLTIAATRPRE